MCGAGCWWVVVRVRSTMDIARDLWKVAKYTLFGTISPYFERTSYFVETVCLFNRIRSSRGGPCCIFFFLLRRR